MFMKKKYAHVKSQRQDTHSRICDITREHVRTLRKDNPCLSYPQIARIVGISDESVRNILITSHLPTKKKIIRFHCLACYNIIANKNTKFCDRKCHYDYYHIPLECHQCHKIFFRRLSDILYRDERQHTHYFCNKVCYGKYLGTTYGFSRFPNHIRSRIITLAGNK